MDQEIGFVRDRHGRSIAWAATGEGPILVADTGFVSHLELQWDYPPYRHFFESLSRERRVIRFDLPGIGLGDPAGEVVTLDDDVAVLEDLVDALGIEQADFFGASQGAAVMAAYAARHHDRVRRLVLYGGYAHGAALSPPELQEAFLTLAGAHWGLASRTLADIFIHGGDQAAQAAFARIVGAAAGQDAAVRRLRECFRTDIRDELARITAPALVLHRREDRNVAFEHGRVLAASIADARLVPLGGRSHVWYVGDVDAILIPVLDFLGTRRGHRAGGAPLSRRERQVATLVRAGLTNGEIGTRLGITERTAESHLEHIRNKLGFGSRSQVAAWAAVNLAEELPTSGS